jgi:hypothetical protein
MGDSSHSGFMVKLGPEFFKESADYADEPRFVSQTFIGWKLAVTM